MKDIYQRIDGSAYRNIWVVGDLHGCYTLLMSKLDEVGFDTTQDLLISVGDLIDRGSENVECLELLAFPWFRAVRGNHEQMMLDAIGGDGYRAHWLANGGIWYYGLDICDGQFAKSLLPRVEALPLIIELASGDKKYVICHADYPHNEYEFGKPVDADQVIWSRERITNLMNDRGCEITGADAFIFGHTPAKAHLKFWNLNYIDTGAVFCGNLTLRQLQGEA